MFLDHMFSTETIAYLIAKITHEVMLGEHVELTRQDADDVFPASANYIVTKPVPLDKIVAYCFVTVTQVRFSFIGSSIRCPSCTMWLTNQRGILRTHSLLTFAIYSPKAELTRKLQPLFAHIYVCQTQLAQ